MFTAMKMERETTVCPEKKDYLFSNGHGTKVSEKLLYVLERSAPALFRALPAFVISSILRGVMAV